MTRLGIHLLSGGFGSGLVLFLIAKLFSYNYCALPATTQLFQVDLQFGKCSAGTLNLSFYNPLNIFKGWVPSFLSGFEDRRWQTSIWPLSDWWSGTTNGVVDDNGDGFINVAAEPKHHSIMQEVWFRMHVCWIKRNRMYITVPKNDHSNLFGNTVQNMRVVPLKIRISLHKLLKLRSWNLHFGAQAVQKQRGYCAIPYSKKDFLPS